MKRRTINVYTYYVIYYQNKYHRMCSTQDDAQKFVDYLRRTYGRDCPIRVVRTDIQEVVL